MTAPELTWLYVLAIVMVYWIAVIGTWMFRVSRPEARVRARERNFSGSAIGPAAGEMTMTFTHSINVTRVAAVFVVPPLLLVLAWAVLR